MENFAVTSKFIDFHNSSMAENASLAAVFVVMIKCHPDPHLQTCWKRRKVKTRHQQWKFYLFFRLARLLLRASPEMTLKTCSRDSEAKSNKTIEQ